MDKFYLTTPIYYVNDRPHIGHAYTTFAADAIAAWRRMCGDATFFLTGTDENALKNAEAAAKRLGKQTHAVTRAEIQSYVNEMSVVWQQTWDSLGVRYDRFIRTTEPAHIAGVKKFIAAVQAKGDLYKGKYLGWYCVGCEAFVTEATADSRQPIADSPICSIHQRPIEQIEEDNYFFRLSKYRNALLAYIEEHPTFVQPESRRNEIVAYIRDHLADVSISRPMKQWGIPFPDDPSQTVYVWFDALTNYLTGVGYGSPASLRGGPREIGPTRQSRGSAPTGSIADDRDDDDGGRFDRYWPVNLHLVGKDIIKFHCALWPAMLMSAGLPLPERVFAHGFFTIDGQKMSKSLGNVVDPVALAERYGTDALRYFLLREIPFGGDGDFSEQRLRERYASDLQHGIGNFAARTITMLQKYADGRAPMVGSDPGMHDVWRRYEATMGDLRLHDALGVVTGLIGEQDRRIEREKPWTLAKQGETDRLRPVLGDLTEVLRHAALMLAPFLPTTADRILTALGQDGWRDKRLADLQQWGGMKERTPVSQLEHLFPPLASNA